MDQLTEIRATVRLLEKNFAWVEVDQGGCGRCHEPGGCGGQQLSQAFCGKPKTYQVQNDLQLAVGDRVLLGLASGAIRRSANLAYVLPLIGLLGGALIGSACAADLGAIVGGSLGIVAAWWMARRQLGARTGSAIPLPKVLSRI